MPDAQTSIVVTDANVLINLIHVQYLVLLSRLPSHRFHIPPEVEAEILLPDQKRELQAAVEAGWLDRTAIVELEALSDYVSMLPTMGRGEAACIALAKQHGWSVASDERGCVARAIKQRLGPGRQLTTPDLLAAAIREGLLSIQEADRMKQVLENHRFKMSFSSFREIIVKIGE